MATYDAHHGGYRVFVGGVNPRIDKYDVEREFESFGKIVDVWVARNPPGFAFLVFKRSGDAQRAVDKMDGRRVFGSRLRVEHANMPSRPNPRDRERGSGRARSPSRSRSRDRSNRRSRRSRSKSKSHSRSRSHSNSRS